MPRRTTKETPPIELLDDDLVQIYMTITGFMNKWAESHDGTLLKHYHYKPDFAVVYTEYLRLRIDFDIDLNGEVHKVSYEISTMDADGGVILFTDKTESEQNLLSGRISSYYGEVDTGLNEVLEDFRLRSVWADAMNLVEEIRRDEGQNDSNNQNSCSLDDFNNDDFGKLNGTYYDSLIDW